jgi:hypothetical protein
MKNPTNIKQLRSFGLTVGGIFLAIGLWPLVLYSAVPRWWAIVPGFLLLLPAALYPMSLLPVYKGWMVIGHVMGLINTRIILGFIFYVVVTPIGIIRRLLGKDPMGRKTRVDLDSYRVVKQPRPASHLSRQY